MHPAELGGQQVQCPVPGHGHELLAAPGRRARAVLQPPLADVRLADPRGVMLRRSQVLQLL